MNHRRSVAPAAAAANAAPASGYVGDALLFFLASGVISVLNYAFAFVAMQILPRDDFGRFNSLLACITISTVVVNSFQLHVTRRVAQLRAAGGAGDYTRAVTRTVTRLCLIGLLAAGAAAPLARIALGATGLEWTLTYTTIAAFLFSTYANGVSAGLLRLRVQSAANLLGTILKLGLGAALLALGFGIPGALAAFFVGLAMVYIITMSTLRPDLVGWAVPTSSPPASARPPASVRPRAAPNDEPLHTTAAPTGAPRSASADTFRLPFILAYLCVVGPFSLDQILVQWLARPLSGDYGAVCTLGKIVFLAVGPVLWVQYSHIASTPGDAHRQRRIFLRGLCVSTLLAAALAAALWILTPLFAQIVLPKPYMYTAHEVGLMAAAIVLYVAGHAVALLLLARGQTSPLFVVAAALALQVVLFATRSASLPTLVTNQIMVYAAQLILICAAALLSRRVGRAHLLTRTADRAHHPARNATNAPPPARVDAPAAPDTAAPDSAAAEDGGHGPPYDDAPAPVAGVPRTGRVVSAARRLTIAYLHPHFAADGGAGRFVLQTALRLAQRGHNVHLITIAAPPSAAAFTAAGVKFHELGGPLSSQLGFWLRFRGVCNRALRIVDEIAPDVLFPQVFPANWWGFYVKRQRPALPCVAFCHEPSAFIHSRDWMNAVRPAHMRALVNLANPILRPIDVALARRADFVLTNSRYTTAYAQSVYAYADAIIENVDLGVDHQRFRPPAETGSPSAATHTTTQRKPQIVTIAKLTRFKNIDIIIRAVARLAAAGISDVKLHIIGQGDARPELEALARELNIADHVVFRGPVDDQALVETLQQSRAFVLASVDEPFGLVAVEAMACGTPAVVVGRGGPAESVIDNESGFHVPPRDYEALAARLTVLLRDDAELARLSRGAVRRAAKYDWERTTDALENAFQRVVRIG